MRIITFGTYDLFHIGHLNIIKRAKKYNINETNKENILFVGVSTDKLNYKKKQKKCIINEKDRMEILNNIKGVDIVFKEESLEQKLEYCLKYKADVLIMGDDHKGRFDYLKNNNIDVVYLSRTPDISTTELLTKIQN